MATVKFSATCIAIYHSELKIPNDIKDDKDAVLAYIRTHLHEANVYDIEWLDDLEPDDCVTASDIRNIIDDDESEISTN